MLGPIRENRTCVIYIRVSTDKQAEEGYGPELQETECRDAIRYNGWTFLKIYKDEGLSGMLPVKDRPGMKELLKDAKNEKFEMVVTYSLCRISRDTTTILDIVKELERFNIGIAVRKDNLDSKSPLGKFVITLIAGLGEMDRKNIIEKMAKGRAERRKQKGYSGGTPPFGFRLVTGQDGKKEIDIHDDEAEVVRKIFSLSSEGVSATRIAEKLNERHIQPRLSNRWSVQTIYRILKRKCDYEGGLMNNNVNNIRWPKII